VRLIASAIVGAIATSPSYAGDDDLDWAAGVGSRLCRDLATISDEELIAWVQGYWTGANLYLGGSDLCLERAEIGALEAGDVRSTIGKECSGAADRSIMVSAFNAMKRLKPIDGSGAANCGVTQ
jgi:hypothetical protein